MSGWSSSGLRKSDRRRPPKFCRRPLGIHANDLAWAAALLIAIVAGVIAGIFIARPSQPARTIRTVIAPPEGTSFRLTGDLAGPPVLSPDGTYVAFSAAAVRRQSRAVGSSHGQA